jgi:hypothetical protein
MSENVNISFIPKKSLARADSVPHRTILGVSLLIPITITFCVIGYSIWVYSHVESLKKQRDDKVVDLEKYEQSLAKDEIITNIDTLKGLIRQIDITSTLLNKHIALTDLFNYIGTITPSKSIAVDGTIESLRPVLYKSFSYSKDTAGVRIVMSGQADSYAVLAALSQLYKDKTNQKAATMLEYALSGFSADKDGKVNFTLTALINPDRISYKRQYGGEETASSVLDLTNSQDIATSSVGAAKSDQTIKVVQ